MTLDSHRSPTMYKRLRILTAFFLGILGAWACADSPDAAPAAAPPSAEQGAAAIFAGGCFWCMEQDFEKLPGGLAKTESFRDEFVRLLLDK